MLRAWREPDDPDGPLRVRVVEIPSGARAGGQRTRCTTVSAETVAAEVAAWLDELRGQR